MNRGHEIAARRQKINELLLHRRRLKAQKKDMQAEVKGTDDEIEKLVDQIKDIEAGDQPVQETLG